MATFTLKSVRLSATVLLKLKNCNKGVPTLFHKPVNMNRYISNMPISKSKSNQTTKYESDIIKSVYISQSNDIFTNLALEHWMYKNLDFSKQHILLLWKNAPCVVIGRHQNPWLEANLTPMAEYQIEIARRNSGGGTVYHDNGNLNLSFFSPQDHYNRKRNLELIGLALNREWKIQTEINKREDMLIDGKYKVSFFNEIGGYNKLGKLLFACKQ